MVMWLGDGVNKQLLLYAMSSISIQINLAIEILAHSNVHLGPLSF